MYSYLLMTNIFDRNLAGGLGGELTCRFFDLPNLQIFRLTENFQSLTGRLDSCSFCGDGQAKLREVYLGDNFLSGILSKVAKLRRV